MDCQNFTQLSKKDTILGMLLRNPEILSLPASTDSTESFSPLWEAMLDGSEEIAELLKEFKVDVNKWYVNFGDEKILLLHYLASSYDWQSKVKIAEILIRLGADINITNDKNETPLQITLSMGNIKCTEFLLKNGAKLGDPEIMMKSLKPGLSCYKEMLLLLLRYGLDTNFHNEDGQNLLHIFLNDDYIGDAVEIVEILVNAGVPLDDCDNSGYSPLSEAIFRCDIELASSLVNRGADINKKYNDGRFPLFSAVDTGDEGLVNFLLSSGAEINAQCKIGWTALHEACYYQSAKMIELLVQNGADINVKTIDDETPFSQILISPEDSDFDECISIMIKQIAKLRFENVPYSEEDLNFIQTNPKPRKYFEKCMSELGQMANTKFYPPFTFYSVLKMSKNIKKLAYLTKNEEFVKNFLAKLSLFPYYMDDLRKIFNEAVEVKNKFMIVYYRLSYIFGETLPDAVLRKMMDNLTINDLPIE